jgi:hypothetical protein
MSTDLGTRTVHTVLPDELVMARAMWHYATAVADSIIERRIERFARFTLGSRVQCRHPQSGKWSGTVVSITRDGRKVTVDLDDGDTRTVGAGSLRVGGPPLRSG